MTALSNLFVDRNSFVKGNHLFHNIAHQPFKLFLIGGGETLERNNGAIKIETSRV